MLYKLIFVAIKLFYLKSIECIDIDIKNSYVQFKNTNLNAQFNRFQMISFKVKNKFECYAKCTQYVECMALVLTLSDGYFECSLYRRNAIINYDTVPSAISIYAAKKSLFFFL